MNDPPVWLHITKLKKKKALMSEAKIDEIATQIFKEMNESKVGVVQICICVILWSRPSTLNCVVYLKVLLQSVKAHGAF